MLIEIGLAWKSLSRWASRQQDLTSRRDLLEDLSCPYVLVYVESEHPLVLVTWGGGKYALKASYA